MAGPFLVPWRVRDSFGAIIGSYLAVLLLVALWAAVLAVQAAFRGSAGSSLEWEEAFKAVTSRSPWLDFFLLLQSFVMLRFARAFLLRRWSVGWGRFVVPGQAPSDAAAALRLFFGFVAASIAIVAAILLLLWGIGRLFALDPARLVQAYQAGIEEEARPLLGTEIGLFRIVPLVLVGPPVEELLYRGCLYGALRRRFVPWKANGASSLVFALSHGYFFGFPNVLLLGILAGWSYERTGSLRTPVFFHVLWNLFCLACAKSFFWIFLAGALLGLTLYSRKKPVLD